VPQGATTILYFYDRQDHLIAEMTPQGNPLITYVWRDDVPVSLIVHGTPEAAVYLETDHLNTPITARNQAGTVVWTWASDAFGSTLPNEDPGNAGKKTTINLRFAGQYFDKESGLLYNMARYYDPRIGRYMSSDPIGLAGGINTFAYVDGNPLSYTDPEGHAKSPVFRCVNCGAPNGGLFGPYCPSCYQKSLDPNGGVPPLWIPPKLDPPV